MFIIRPGSPNDFSAEELAALQDAIRQAADGVSVGMDDRTERGYGVTLWEVIQITGDIAGAIGAVDLSQRAVGAAVRWAQERWRRNQSDNPRRKPRPKCIVLYDGSGRVVRKVLIDAPDGEPKELPSDHANESEVRDS